MNLSASLRAALSPSLARIDDFGIDADASAFIVATGATNRDAIFSWVAQIKAAGLWSLIRAYPMRSGQNAGTGTTVFGLGGLNSANGVLTGAPLWQADGVQFLLASGQYMTATISSSSANYSAGAAVSMLTTGGPNSCIIGVNGTSNADAMQINDAATNVLSGGHRTVAGSTNVSTPDQAFTANSPLFTAQGWDGSVVRRTTNGVVVTAVATTFGGAITPFRVNSRGDAATTGQNKRVAFAFYLVGAGSGSAATQETLRTIYKATLGVGLGLP
jgi:hypothetical protein